MTIALQHPARRRPSNLPWFAAGAAAIALAAATWASVTLVDTDGPSTPPATQVNSDPSGLGAALAVEIPSPTIGNVTDPSGLGAALSVAPSSVASVSDPTGLGGVFGVQFPSVAPVSDPTGLGAVFGVQFPTTANQG
jgi:hypothetical protein